MRDSKFLEFEQYLTNCNQSLVELTFKEIEAILHEKLSPSAYNHKPYWHLSKTHYFPKAWITAGYKLNKLDLVGQKASFIKVDFEDTISIKHSEPKQPQTPKLLTYKVKPLIEIDFAISKANEFLQNLNDDENSRFKSWEHCYKTFASCKELSEQNIDNLSLNLFSYLASWGMLRGSAFLLKKDYRVHNDAVKELYNPRYKVLWGISCETLLEDNNIDLVMELSEKLKVIYVEKRRNLDSINVVSDILITKILMGVMACVPAYDRFFAKTLKKYKIASGNFNKQSLSDLALFYKDNSEKLEIFRHQLSSSRNVEYPQMKVLDMAFWNISYEKNSNSLSEKE